MKIIKGIGLYFLYPLVFLLLGFAGGICFVDYFYPYRQMQYKTYENLDKQENSLYLNEEDPLPSPSESPLEVNPVVMQKEILTADTLFVLWEYDLSTQTFTETEGKVSEKYLGMNREQYIESMNEYALSPPLSELEKGFDSLSVVSFSRERVVLQKNYRTVPLEETFFLLAYNGYVVVFLEDKETIYLYTDILLEDLPFEIQSEIINAKQITGEEQLYHFLENYTS